MKKIIYLLCLSCLAISCETIEGPYLTDNQNSNNTDETIKKILIEDYTGHLCPNCPDAARELDAIHDVYGDQIIGMAIHVTNAFARPYPVSQAPKFQYDFRTLWGDTWDDLFSISDLGLPKGMINRTGYTNNSYRLGKDEWLERVQQELEKDPEIKINIITTDNSGNEGSINISVSLINDINKSLNLAICLTESQIINWQKDGSIEDEDYEHNHVLKAVLFDDLLSEQNNYLTNDIINKNLNYNINTLEIFNNNYSLNTAQSGNGNAGNWNINNMSVVAYVYDPTTYEILQVEEKHLIN